MSPRKLRILAISIGAGLTVAIVALLLTGNPRRDPWATNPLVGRPNMVDRLEMFDTDQQFLAGQFEHISVIHDKPPRLVLDDRRLKTYPRYGFWTSPIVETEFGFTELIPSWNVTTPPNTGVRFHVRTRDARGGEWSPWLYIGQWGRTMIATGQDRVVRVFRRGTVHIDNLVLDRPASAFQIRASLQSFDTDTQVNPSIRRIAVSYSGQVNDEAVRRELVRPVTYSGYWARDLNVPFRAQGNAPPPLRSQICSPTSTTMVMAYHGVVLPTVDNATAIYDAEADIFGNWGRAVARAGEFGLDAWITRFRNWDQVKAMIAAGIPVIADVEFAEGEFPSSVIKSTDGHLLVVRGFKPNGDVICNDPASRDKGNGVIYKADELGKAWFTNAGGVGYVIRKPASGNGVAAR